MVANQAPARPAGHNGLKMRANAGVWRFYRCIKDCIRDVQFSHDGSIRNHSVRKDNSRPHDSARALVRRDACALASERDFRQRLL
jgi:hypothetical protein